MRKYVFRSASQQHDRDKVTTYNKRKDIRVMVDGMGSYLSGWFERPYGYKAQSSASKHGYTTKSYLKVLQDGLLRKFRANPIYYKTALKFTPQDLRRHDFIGFTHTRADQRKDVSPSLSPLSGSPDIRLCCEAALHFTSIDSVHKALLHANESSTTPQLTACLFFLCLFAESALNALLLL
jgi:hypothetical protein